MAYAFLVSESAVAKFGPITTAAIDTTGANLLVVAVGQGANHTIGTPTDSYSNTWLGLTAQQGANPPYSYTRIYYCFNPVVGSGHTFTYNNGNLSIFGSVVAMAYSGAVTSPFDQENGSKGTSTTSRAPGSVTPSEGSELLVTSCSTDSGQGSAVAVDGGFTVREINAHVSDNWNGLAAADLIQTTVAAANPSWSWTNSIGSSVAIATFKDTPAATRDQEGFRWRADDGDEDAASWLANQDTNISRAKSTPTRLRVLTNVTNDPPSEGLKLQYRKVGDDGWRDL